MFNSFRLHPATFLVVGALLVPSVVWAQSAPSIVPVDNAAAPVPASVAAPNARVSTQPIIDSMSFRSVDVSELLSMISTQFDVPIAIAGDVTGKINAINLKGITADQAISTVTRVAGLSCEKVEGTYIISKAAPVTSASETGSVVPNLPPITQSGFANGSMAANRARGADKALDQFGSPNADVNALDDEPTLAKISNAGDARKRTFQMTVRNIKPSLMAYWLDPANHEAPVEIRSNKNLDNRYIDGPIRFQALNGPNQTTNTSGNNQGSGNQNFGRQGFNTQGLVPDSNPYLNSNAEAVQTYSDAQFGGGNGGGGFGGNNGGGNNNNRGGRGGANGGGVFQLPNGVDRIVAVDPQNALLVFGTPQGAAELAATIRFLDRPLRQVEIEAQFLSIQTSASKAYGFDFSSARGNVTASNTGNVATSGLLVSYLKGNFQANISAAVNDGRAKVLTAPRVLAINNLTAVLEQSVSTPIIITTTTTTANNATTTQASQQVFFVTTSIGLEVTPTINNDDTITVLMQPQLQTQGTPNSLGASTITSQSLRTIANVRDGETVALGGLRTKNVNVNRTKVPLLSEIPLVGQFFGQRANSDVETELIIFLTARIIRRAGDEDGVAAASDIPVGVGGG